MKRILWIAPNLNHYKARFLSRLVATGDCDITVLAGRQRTELGHRPNEAGTLFSTHSIPATKKNFNTHLSVYTRLWKLISTNSYDFVLMPVEKKHVFVIFFLSLLKKRFGFQFISYSHPVTRGSALGPYADKYISKLLFGVYDRIVFYTGEARDWSVDSGLLPAGRACFANNTLDTQEIWEHYSFEINRAAQKVILFVGRLIPKKRLDLLIAYHRELSRSLPGVRLVIIGDGPEADTIGRATRNDASITWHGAIVDEAKIAPLMRAAHLILIPGWSGLSIVHAFCYGKPYATIAGPHPPEIAYLKDGDNGLILSGDLEKDCQRITSLLNDEKAYAAMCRSAFNKAKELSIENWCAQMQKAFDI